MAIDTLSIFYGSIGLIVAVLLFNRFTNPLHSLPTVGPSAPGLSYIGARRWVKHARAMILEGCEKYPGGIFKVANYDRWLVVVNGSRWIEEIIRYPDEVMSFERAGEELIQAKYTLGAIENKYHNKVVKGQLTRALGPLFPDIADEIDFAFRAFVGENTDAWVPKHIGQLLMKVVARTSNRVFVGTTKCRDEDFLQLVTDFAVNVIKKKRALDAVPEFLKPIYGAFLTRVKQDIQATIIHLRPMIEERKMMLEKYGEDWLGKPNDALMWLMEEAEIAGGDDVYGICHKVLTLNFAAIHTSTNSIQHALHHLAASSEYQNILRKEVEPIIKEYGWTKNAMSKMWKVDSFMKESQRINGISAVSVHRVTNKAVRLSNGAVIPANTMIVAAATVTHMDDENYSNPTVFNPFRFSDLRSQEEAEATKHQFVSTSLDYIPFGHGRHACPGRFFAANELKAILAYVLVNYDIKFENEGIRPPNIWHDVHHLPWPNAEILFKKRKVDVAQ